jgi:hypothetical protein
LNINFVRAVMEIGEWMGSGGDGRSSY